MSFSIRPLRHDDVDTVVAFGLRAWEPIFESWANILGPRLFTSAYPDWRATQAQSIRDNCQPEKHPCWVAEADGRAVGLATLVHNQDEQVGAIELLAVDPDYQGRGIATALIDTAIAESKNLGCKRIEVWTGGDPGHGPARRSYEKAGFTALPVVHYYREV